MLAAKGLDRVIFVAFGLVALVAALVFLGKGSAWYDAGSQTLSSYTGKWNSVNLVSGGRAAAPVSYDLSTPPSIGCEELVSKLQLRLIEAYSKMLRGIRYANIWGYLETENKGDAAIWVAQQMLFATLGITTEQSCRKMEVDCDIQRFNDSLTRHAPNAAIIMAGGGNFNDYHWEDQPARIKMIESFTQVPIRAFPQSVYMTHEDRIQMTKDSFRKHHDLMLAARDRASWEWLDENLDKAEGIPSVLVPDVAFMWGNRPDFRLDTKKTVDVLILARDDTEISAGNSTSIKWGPGVLDLGGKIGNVTYNKVDWKFSHTPGIDSELPSTLWFKQHTVPDPRPGPTPSTASEELSEDDFLFHNLDFGTKEQQEHGTDLMYTEFPKHREAALNARAWAKAIAGFQLLGSAKFVITDRLHGHIMSTIMGTPHVLMDSLLGKNLNFHNTWTQDCDCVRITDNIEDAKMVARKYFEANGL